MSTALLYWNWILRILMNLSFNQKQDFISNSVLIWKIQFVWLARNESNIIQLSKYNNAWIFFSYFSGTSALQERHGQTLEAVSQMEFVTLSTPGDTKMMLRMENLKYSFAHLRLCSPLRRLVMQRFRALFSFYKK